MRQQRTIPAELVLIVIVILVALVLIFAFLRLSGSTATSSVNSNQSAEQSQTAASSQRDTTSTNTRIHIVQTGETLISIAAQYDVAYADIMDANDISNPDTIQVGQSLAIPVFDAAAPVTTDGQIDPAAILVPDSKLVYGPAGREFDTSRFIDSYYSGSVLKNHSEAVEGVTLDGTTILQLVADRTRVDPRLLLAALEFRSNWVTQATASSTYPLGNSSIAATLYGQLEWAANQINKGYYGRAEGGLSSITLADGSVVNFAPESNFGTSGILYWLGQAAANRTALEQDAGRFVQVYEQLFGSIYDGADESFYQGNISQPTLRLPWEDGVTWYFTGGPHGGWANGSAWSALDFAPPEPNGCAPSAEWLVAVADGVIARSEMGAVVLDLDRDGYAGTGWAILYQHVATQDRIAEGTRVRAGDRIGRASCEGGVSTGTHLHIARTYNGRWISADQGLPFNLGGWQSLGDGEEYNGTLVNGNNVKTATVGRFDINGITAP